MTWQLGILIAASLLALQLFSIFTRREQREQLPYALLMAADLLLLVLVYASGSYDSLLGKVTASLALVMALAPRFLDSGERFALSRDDLAGALRLAKLRELLAPGLASSRRRRQLANLLEARAAGVATVIRRLQTELEAVHDAREAESLHEELATVLFLAQRWQEGVSEAERHLPVDFSARRPGFGAFLVRAYGELGHLERAAATLQLVEDGPVRSDPMALGLLTQARLTFLSFAGRTAALDQLLAGAAGQLLPPRAHDFLRDTARAHATVALPVETASFADGVVTRVAATAQPLVRPARRLPLVTFGLVAANQVMALVAHLHLVSDGDPARLSRLGALCRSACGVGQYWRAFTALFLHNDGLHLAFNMLLLLLFGRFCEDVLGRWRFFVTYVGAGLVGAWASSLEVRNSFSVGASGAIMGLLGALIVLLILRRGSWPDAWRRALLWNLLLLGALQIYIGWKVQVIDNAAHVGGLLGGAAIALAMAPGGLMGNGRLARALAVLIAVTCLSGLAWAGVEVARTPLAATLDELPTKTVQLGGAQLIVPRAWEVDGQHVVDPVLGISILPRIDGHVVRLSSPQAGDPRYHQLIERIERSARPVGE